MMNRLSGIGIGWAMDAVPNLMPSSHAPKRYRSHRKEATKGGGEREKRAPTKGEDSGLVTPKTGSRLIRIRKQNIHCVGGGLLRGKDMYLYA